MDDAVLTVTGRDVLFVHWPLAPESVGPHVPDGLTVDTHDGRAWVSALAHRVVGVRPRGLPAAPGPVRRSFPQLNFRTYVRHGDDRGVHFLDCESGDRLGAAVARRVFGIPFHPANASLTGRGGRFTFRSARRTDDGDVRFDARYRPAGEPTPVEDGSRDAFLVERSRWYAGDPLRVGDVEHDRWLVGPVDADVRTNTLFEAVGLPAPDAEPRVGYSPGFRMRATPLRRAEGGDAASDRTGGRA
jgi:uncharacterized protein YqjF (DUF2071 family)